MGPPERSHLRLTLSQAFNSLGTVIGPYLGAVLMLHGGMFGADGGAANAAAQRIESLRNIDTSFFLLAAMIVVLVLFVWKFRHLFNVAPPMTHERDSVISALQSPWALFGAAAIFLYVGAEVSVGSNLINFLHQPDVLGMDKEEAGTGVSR